MTLSSQITDLTNATTDLLAAVNVRKAALDSSISTAIAQITQLTANANAVSVSSAAAVASAVEAANSATTATTQATLATTQVTSATTAAATAATSASTLSAALLAFNKKYLGIFTTDALATSYASTNSLPLVSGVMYENSVANKFRIYNGTAWFDYDATAQAAVTTAAASATAAGTSATASASSATASAASAASITGATTTSATNAATATTQAALATSQATAAATSAAAAASSASTAATGGVRYDTSQSFTVPQLAQVQTNIGLSAVGKTGAYSDLLNKPVIPTVPTALSAFTNDSAYVTVAGARAGLSVSGTTLSYNAATGVLSYTAPTLAAVATSGSYADLLNKPTLSTVSGTGSYTDLLNKPTIPTVPTVISAFTNDSVYVNLAQARAGFSVTGYGSYVAATGVLTITSPVTTVAGKAGVVVLTSADVGLGLVENKSATTILAGLTSANVTTALTFTPYNATNPSGFINGTGSTSGNAGTATLAVAATNIAGGTVGQIPYQTAVGTTGFISNGTAGQVLTSNGTGAPTMQTAGSFAAGTRLVFAQTAAPTGWTKDVTNNDAALRVVSGAAGTGGVTAFSTVFAAAGLASSAVALSAAQVPSHNHGYTSWGNVSPTQWQWDGLGMHFDSSGQGTDSRGGNGSHTHTTAMQVKYVDTIIATKD